MSARPISLRLLACLFACSACWGELRADEPWSPGPWPALRTYDADHLLRIALPLGGIGTGTVSLGGRGELRDWEIMNRPAKGFFGVYASPLAPFFAVSAVGPDGVRVTRQAAGPLDRSEYLHQEGYAPQNHGLPRFSSACFRAAYPFGEVLLSNPALPVSLKVRGFNPLVPGDTASSSLPVAALFYEVRNETDAPLTVSVCGQLPNFIGQDGSRYSVTWKGLKYPEGASSNRNDYVEGRDFRGFRLTSQGVATNDTAWGTMAFVTTAREGVTYGTNVGDLLTFWDDFTDDGALACNRQEGVAGSPMAALCVKRTVPARGVAVFPFYLTWSFPNRPLWATKVRVRNHYTLAYPDAWAAAETILPRLPALEAKTRAFVESVLAADAPDVLKEAALFNLATLRSQTVFRVASGELMGWEGIFDTEGSCWGSCTHVWNYEAALPYLFPDLARSMREVEFLHSLCPSGLMNFRTRFLQGEPDSKATPAADGQLGCILKAYREWKLSGDDAWLVRLWPNVRRALAFAWEKTDRWRWDADEDGVLDGCQHNTMDCEYYGPNPQMTFWYLAALKAGAEMARAQGDVPFAAKCEGLLAKGAAWADANLFNGEYYEQRIPAGCSEPKQIGTGCLVDQLVGLTMATMCGLEIPVDPVHRRQAIASVWKYNHRDDMSGEFRHNRSYAMGGEGGLLMATWPHGGREKRPFPYYSEVMTGFEYVAATEMIYAGMRDEALRVVTDIRARHDGAKRNPFSEPECGHHYARSLASWGTFRAWTEKAGTTLASDSAPVRTVGLDGLFPPDVRTVGLVSASYVLSKEKFDLGTNLLARAGYRVKAMPNVLRAVSPEERAKYFEQAWLDPEIDFLLFTCGGKGASNVVSRIDWNRLRSRKMRVMGFSDVTMILNAMDAQGVGRPIAGPMLSTLTTYCSTESARRLRQVLDGTPPPLGLHPVTNCEKPVRGFPVGGLLSRFPVLKRQNLLPSFAGRVVILECTPKYADLAEPQLNELIGQGVFDNAAAVVFADFNRTWEKERTAALIARFAAKVKCSVFSGYPFGHVGRSFAFDFTRPLTITPKGILSWEISE